MKIAAFTCNDVVSVVYRWKSFHTRTSLSAKKVMNLVICGGKVHLLMDKITSGCSNFCQKMFIQTSQAWVKSARI